MNYEGQKRHLTKMLKLKPEFRKVLDIYRRQWTNQYHMYTEIIVAGVKISDKVIREYEL